MRKNINDKINKALDEFKETILVYLKKTNSVGSNFDPYRNVGYVETFQSPIPVKAMIHQISSNGLMVKELGLVSTGAIEITVNDNDASLIQNASKLEYKKKFYTTYTKALGSRTLITDVQFGMKKIVCFLEGN